MRLAYREAAALDEQPEEHCGEQVLERSLVQSREAMPAEVPPSAPPREPCLPFSPEANRLISRVRLCSNSVYSSQRCCRADSPHEKLDWLKSAVVWLLDSSRLKLSFAVPPNVFPSTCSPCRPTWDSIAR